MEPMIRAGDQVSITCCPIGEIMTATGGASACLAPSALSVQSYAESLCDGYYRALGEEHVSYLGDALLEGFLELYGVNPDIAELKSYTIFGDPAQLIWGGARP